MKAVPPRAPAPSSWTWTARPGPTPWPRWCTPGSAWTGWYRDGDWKTRSSRSWVGTRRQVGSGDGYIVHSGRIGDRVPADPYPHLPHRAAPPGQPAAYPADARLHG